MFNDQPLLGGGSSEDIYSTEETRIGTWIDGKPVYRRILSLNTGNLVKNDNNYDISYIDIDFLCSFNGCFSYNKASSNLFGPLPFVWTYYNPNGQISEVPQYIGIYYDKNTKRIIECHSFEGLSNLPMWLKLEYTKTTD